jgi:uncharacterized protein (TIGR02001 family)
MKKGILLTATVLGTLISVPAMAEVSGNIGATSNYLWRGVEQAAGSGAFSAGADYNAASGAYAGIWGSSLDDFGQEIDLYAGYKKELGNGVGYDVGAIKYFYPTANGDSDFAEVYGKVGYKGVGAEVDYTIDGDKTGAVTKKGDVYYALGYTGTIKEGLSYNAKVGRYNYKNDAQDYSHVQVSMTKTFKKAGDFTLALDKPSKSGLAAATNGSDDPVVSLSWKKSFDF